MCTMHGDQTWGKEPVSVCTQARKPGSILFSTFHQPLGKPSGPVQSTSSSSPRAVRFFPCPPPPRSPSLPQPPKQSLPPVSPFPTRPPFSRQCDFSVTESSAAPLLNPATVLYWPQDNTQPLGASYSSVWPLLSLSTRARLLTFLNS